MVENWVAVASNIGQWVKAPAVQGGDLGSIPGTQGGRKEPTPSGSQASICRWWHMCVIIHIYMSESLQRDTKKDLEIGRFRGKDWSPAIMPLCIVSLPFHNSYSETS